MALSVVTIRPSLCSARLWIVGFLVRIGIVEHGVQVDQGDQIPAVKGLRQIDEVGTLAGLVREVGVQPELVLQDHDGGVSRLARARADMRDDVPPGVRIVLVDHQIDGNLIGPVAVVDRRDADVADFGREMPQGRGQIAGERPNPAPAGRIRADDANIVRHTTVPICAALSWLRAWEHTIRRPGRFAVR